MDMARHSRPLMAHTDAVRCQDETQGCDNHRRYDVAILPDGGPAWDSENGSNIKERDEGAQGRWAICRKTRDIRSENMKKSTKI